MLALGVFAACLLAGAPAFGAEGDSEESARGVAAAEAGWGRLGEDSFFNLRLKLGYRFELPQIACEEEEPDGCQTDLRLGAQAPLRFRAVDRGPQNPSLLREADWDEPSDYLRIVRLVEYGHASEPLHAKIGELGPISMGHGSIVNDYYNVITVDHYQMGLAGELSTAYGGVELMLDNVVSPSVMGARAVVRPWAFVDRDSFLSRVAIGATVASDIDAPTALAAQADQPDSVVDQTYNPIVTDSQTTGVFGIDLEVSLLEEERFGLVPYVDLNTHSSLGSGVHAGTFATVRPLDSLELVSQLEYRRLGQNYLPSYVGPLYEIDRFQFAGWGQELPAPKVRVAASLDGQPAHGVYGSLTANVDELFSLTAAYADHEGPANQMVRLHASAQPIDRLQMGLFYYKHSFEGLSEAFDFDGALAVGEARLGLYGPLFALGSYGRMWRIQEDGAYGSIDDWNLGLGVAMGL